MAIVNSTAATIAPGATLASFCCCGTIKTWEKASKENWEGRGRKERKGKS